MSPVALLRIINFKQFYLDNERKQIFWVRKTILINKIRMYFDMADMVFKDFRYLEITPFPVEFPLKWIKCLF